MVLWGPALSRPSEAPRDRKRKGLVRKDWGEERDQGLLELPKALVNFWNSQLACLEGVFCGNQEDS
jgi:hypothetical protein